jgi:predicted aspartyl protease
MALEPGSISFKLASSRKPLILVPVFVNGRGPFQFAVDTGASRTYLAPRLARELGIVAITDQPGKGSGGQVSILSGTAGSLRVGVVSVRDLSVGVGGFLGLMSEAADTNLDGVLGDNFLSQFEVTIDYPQRIFALKPLAVK